MRKAKQISVAIANKPGTLAHVANCLAERGVNITALTVADSADQCILRMVVDKPDIAVEVFQSTCPMAFSTEDVLVADMRNKPGALARLANKLARMAWAMMAKGERYKGPVALALRTRSRWASGVM